jgi:hypothetical protein
MTTTILAALGLSLTLAACAAPTGPDEETVASQSDELRNGGGGDPDACTAARGACYGSCKASGNGSCYRYCDIIYSRCRGLPTPGGEVVVRAAEPSPTTARP